MIDLDSPEQFMQKRMRSVDRRRFLQARTSSQVVDFTARTYQKLAWPILKLSLPASTLLFVSMVFVQAFVLPGIFQTRTSGEITQQLEEVVMVVATFIFLAVPIGLVAMAHIIGLTTRAVADYVLEQRVDFERAKDAAFLGVKTMFALLLQIFWRCGVMAVVAGLLFMVSAYFENSGNNVLSEIMTVIAVFALIVAFLVIPFFFGTISMAPAVSVVEEVGAKLALKRGAMLIKGARHIASGYDALLHIWVVAVICGLLLWGGLYSALETVGAFSLLSELSGQTIISTLIADTLATLPSFAAMWLLVPYLACGLTIVYFDRRVKLEALDIEAMARDAIEGTQKADLRG